MKEEKVALVTGSSSGIGFETALALARSGFETYATMRDVRKGERIKREAEGTRLHVLQLDVTSDQSVRQAVDTIMKENGRIDVLVNNAGYGLFGPVEELSMEELKAQFETNFFGLVRVTQAVLPAMRKQEGGGGKIINISSIGGRVGFPGSPAYCSTKFAVEGLSETMAFELEPFGIRVVLVEPGMIKTNFAGAGVVAKNTQDPGSPYAPFIQKMFAAAAPLVENAIPAQEVADAVVTAAVADDPEFRYLVGRDAKGLARMKAGARSDREFLASLKKLHGL
ncbi:SDR family oxidoreductase [Nitrososphaera sp.]|uniref:SDR family oxidoreductase n=1 Tax=Nitrososphaera sp. TaxID=1971748 RepID=UPI00307D368E